MRKSVQFVDPGICWCPCASDEEHDQMVKMIPTTSAAIPYRVNHQGGCACHVWNGKQWVERQPSTPVPSPHALDHWKFWRRVFYVLASGICAGLAVDGVSGLGHGDPMGFMLLTASICVPTVVMLLATVAE